MPPTPGRSSGLTISTGPTVRTCGAEGSPVATTATRPARAARTSGPNTAMSRLSRRNVIASGSSAVAVPAVAVAVATCGRPIIGKANLTTIGPAASVTTTPRSNNCAVPPGTG